MEVIELPRSMGDYAPAMADLRRSRARRIGLHRSPQEDIGAQCVEHALQGSSDHCFASETEIRSDGLLLNSLVDRSLRDLHLSKTNIGAQEFFAAGVPWYVTLFGRDGLIASPDSRL